MRKRSNRIAECSALLTNDAPFAYTEAYKTLRTNLSFASITKQYKRIIITSAIPGEGKSTIAVNLAITLAESGAKVLLAGCDMRNPTLNRLLGVRMDYKEGLTSVLTNKASEEDCIFCNPKLKCDVLLAGTTPPNPAELLSSLQMKNLLDRLSKKYDYIICDTPPVGVVTDAAVLSQFCDGIILVVRQKSTTRDQVWAAKRNLDAVQANIVGTVMSCYDMSSDSQVGNAYYGGYYPYGHLSERRKRIK